MAWASAALLLVLAAIGIRRGPSVGRPAPRALLAVASAGAAALALVVLTTAIGAELAVPAWLALAGLAGGAVALLPATGPWVWIPWLLALALAVIAGTTGAPR